MSHHPGITPIVHEDEDDAWSATRLHIRLRRDIREHRRDQKSDYQEIARVSALHE
jgi:hypothetical protein